MVLRFNIEKLIDNKHNNILRIKRYMIMHIYTMKKL